MFLALSTLKTSGCDVSGMNRPEPLRTSDDSSREVTPDVHEKMGPLLTLQHSPLCTLSSGLPSFNLCAGIIVWVDPLQKCFFDTTGIYTGSSDFGPEDAQLLPNGWLQA